MYTKSVVKHLQRALKSCDDTFHSSSLRKAREFLDMSRQKFAKWLGGFSTSTVEKWENNIHTPGHDAQCCMKRKILEMKRKMEKDCEK